MNLFILAQTDLAAAAGPDLMPPLWKMFGALALVLAILLWLGWALRKGALVRRSTGAMGVETALALGERRSLVIVTVEGRRLLLGLSPGNIALVTELKPIATFDETMAKVVQRSQSA